MTRYASLAASRTSIWSTTSFQRRIDDGAVGCAEPSAVAGGVLGGDQLGDRLHVVGADAGNGPRRDVRQRIVIEMELLFVHAEHVPALERLGHLFWHRAEILADDGDAGSRSGRRDDGEEFLAWVVHVDTAVGGESVGYPPEPFDRHRVVDAEDVAVAADPFDQRRQSRCPLACIAAGSGGGKPQFWPSAKNESGGAPTAGAVVANIDGSAQTS